MTWRRTLLLVTAVALAGLAAAPAAAATPQDAAETHSAPADAAAAPSAAQEADNATDDACTAVASGDAPADPEDDRLGWENGCWYNESVDVTREDGLNETELDAVVARSMARVEEVRELEFERTPPVEVISRSAFANQTARQYENVTSSNSRHQNVKFEALFMVDEETDALGVQQNNTASNVLGYYDPEADRIAIVSENETAPRMNEITLSQELFHAMQYNQFEPGEWNWSTREQHNANDGIIEGDGNFVDHLYQQRCEANWSCLMPTDTPGGAADVHVGMLAVELQPYSDGPVFVQEIYEAGGWEAVNDVYDDPPASTEQTIHTDKYGEDAPANVSVADRSGDEWEILDLPAGVNYAEFGEAGMYTMLWYPGYETQGQSTVIPPNDFFVDGELDLYNYDHRYTAGWDGDRLYPYVREDSEESGETGYVWKSVWDSPEDAEEFAAGYEQLLTVRGANEVGDRADTYRIPDDERFGDAFYVNQTGDTVVIVNAPTAADLAAVREGAAPEATPTPTDAPTTTAGTETPTDSTETATDGDGASGETTEPPADGTDETTAEDGPGFGLLAAVAGLLAVVLARRR